MRRPATALPAILCALVAVAGCGGGDDAAVPTAPATTAVPGDAPADATLDGVRYAFTGVDCVDRPDGVIASAWGPDGLGAELYLHAGTRSAALNIPDDTSIVPRSWLARTAELAWDAPVVTATGTASTLGGSDQPRRISVRITCPAQRGAGSGRIRMGDRTLVPVWVGCRHVGTEQIEVFARGAVDGRRWAISLTRRLSADGHGDEVVGLNAIRGRSSAIFRGDGDLGGRPGTFTLRGDRVRITAPNAGLHLAGDRPGGVTGTLTCGLNVQRI